MPSLIGPELQCLSSFLRSPGDFGHYFLQEAPFYMGLSDPWDMQDILQSNQHFGLDILLVYTPQSKKFQTTEVKPPPLAFQKPTIYIFYKFFGCINSIRIERYLSLIFDPPTTQHVATKKNNVHFSPKFADVHVDLTEFYKLNRKKLKFD